MHESRRSRVLASSSSRPSAGRARQARVVDPGRAAPRWKRARSAEKPSRALDRREHGQALLARSPAHRPSHDVGAQLPLPGQAPNDEARGVRQRPSTSAATSSAGWSTGSRRGHSRKRLAPALAQVQEHGLERDERRPKRHVAASRRMTGSRPYGCAPTRASAAARRRARGRRRSRGSPVCFAAGRIDGPSSGASRSSR